MAIQILQDGPRNVIVKLDLVVAGAVAATELIDPADLGPIDNYSNLLANQLAIKKITYDVQSPGSVTILWDATTDVTAVTLAGHNTMCFAEGQPLQNNAGTGKTGIINYSAVDGATDYTVTVVLELIKQRV